MKEVGVGKGGSGAGNWEDGAFLGVKLHFPGLLPRLEVQEVLL